MITLSPLLQAKFIHEAIDYFDIAIALRPNSAYLWAGRMTAGSMLLEINAKSGRDKQFAAQELSMIATALRHAGELGPWEPNVLTQMVRVGRLNYAVLSPEARVLVDSAVARAGKLTLTI